MIEKPTPTEFVTKGATKTFGQAVQTSSVDQTEISQKIKQGNYTPENPFPTDPVRGHVEFAKNISRNLQPGKFGQFIAFQSGFYATNPAGANIINPPVVSGVIPGEGIIPTTVAPTSTSLKDVKEPSGVSKAERMGSALAGGTLGQEEGTTFVRGRSTSIGDYITSAANALAGALGIKNNNTDLVPLSPSQATLERRLTQNRLNPENSGTVKDAYNAVYNSATRGFRAQGGRISGVKLSTLQEHFKPIEDGDTVGVGKLSDDTMLRDDLDRGFESNAPFDERRRSYSPNGLELEVGKYNNAAFQDEAPDFTPPVEKGGMVFPFYFESLNFFSQHPEKYIAFQATFAGINENFTPAWTPQVFFGRSNPVYSYQSTTRTIGFNFTIWASNRSALNIVKQRVNWLARHCYPSYIPIQKTTSRIMFEAPVITFTIGDLFKRVPAIIQSLTYDWDMNDNNRWELTKDMIMPQACNVQIQLAVLHDRFMQNAGIATESKNGKESSDFYSFIRPKNRGIVDPIDFSVEIKSLGLNEKGDAFEAVTVQEADQIITETGGAS